MTDSPSLVTRASSTIAATLILLAPALWNRLPLLEYDTGGYLARWFEGYLVPSRSTTYGLFLTAGWPLDFWPIVVLQALATVWIIGLLLRTHRFAVHPIALPAITAVLALTTALPWLASALLTEFSPASPCSRCMRWCGTAIACRVSSATRWCCSLRLQARPIAPLLRCCLD